jgi:hypothetical protein
MELDNYIIDNQMNPLIGKKIHEMGLHHIKERDQLTELLFTLLKSHYDTAKTPKLALEQFTQTYGFDVVSQILMSLLKSKSCLPEREGDNNIYWHLRRHYDTFDVEYNVEAVKHETRHNGEHVGPYWYISGQDNNDRRIATHWYEKDLDRQVVDKLNTSPDDHKNYGLKRGYFYITVRYYLRSGSPPDRIGMTYGYHSSSHNNHSEIIKIVKHGEPRN